jgi:hypothetical protein
MKSTDHNAPLYVIFSTPFLFNNILLSTQFIDNLCLCSFLNVRDQFSRPCKTKAKLEIWIVLSSYLSITKWTTKYSAQNSKHTLSPTCS